MAAYVPQTLEQLIDVSFMPRGRPFSGQRLDDGQREDNWQKRQRIDDVRGPDPVHGDDTAGHTWPDEARCVEDRSRDRDGARKLLGRYQVGDKRQSNRRVSAVGDAVGEREHQQQLDGDRIEQGQHGEENRNAHHDAVHQDGSVARFDAIDDDAEKRRQNEQRCELRAGDQADHERRFGQFPGLPAHREALNPQSDDHERVTGDEYPVILAAER